MGDAGHRVRSDGRACAWHRSSDGALIVTGGERTDGPIPLAGLGPFFAVHLNSEDVESDTSWRHLSADLANQGFVNSWVWQMRSRFAIGLGTSPAEVNERATRSVLHLGLCARLLSPWIALQVYGHNGGISPWNDLRWQPDGTTRFALATVGCCPAEGDWVHDAVARVLEPLWTTGLVTSQPIASGNIASAVSGAITAIASSDPERGEVARELGRQLCEAAEAPFTGVLGTPEFRRRSCCLMNSLTPATRDAICGDCVHQPRSSAQSG